MLKECIDILLVEDNQADARLTQEVLKESAMPNRLSIAKDGVEALHFLRREGPYAGAPSPDLILLDLNLPKKDGREVLREVKKDPVLRRIPVAVLTTSRAEQDVLNAYEHHANCYICKPLDIDQFAQAVRVFEDFWFMIATLPPKPALLV